MEDIDGCIFCLSHALRCERQHSTVVKARAVAIECLSGFEPQVCHKWCMSPSKQFDHFKFHGPHCKSWVTVPHGVITRFEGDKIYKPS